MAEGFADPAVVGGRLGTDWWVDPEPGRLMTIPLTGTAPGPLPVGHRQRTWSAGGVARTMIVAPDGSLAARGQIAPTGATAVVDLVETAPAHRRRGFGTLVLHTLPHTAHAQGAHTAILNATPEGRALYASLGRRAQAPETSARFTAAAR
ncbi:GNAT family N-acetyltransferase [Streptomyces sp. NPDC005820]|uniref:GNAT family N-acetyltransferase n=1 Tax=Streptomyces sp. NPDC005820 TaxID=3157069 RepID=UPI003406D3CF